MTDPQMIYGCSCDAVLTRLAFTMDLIFPLSRVSPSFLPHSSRLVFSTSLLQFQSSRARMSKSFKTSGYDSCQISGKDKKRTTCCNIAVEELEKKKKTL